MTRKPHLFTILVMVGAALGILFATFSSADFARHLDRQLHSVTCSFTPGLSEAEVGESGCKETMFSAYSSFMRRSVWGGVPISLPAISVFAFILLFAVELLLTRRQEDTRATGFLALATALPALTSVVMAFISFAELDAACKLCIGIYFSSAVALLGGVCLWRRAVQLERTGEIEAIEQRARERVTKIGHATAEDEPSGDPAWAQSGPKSVPAADPLAATVMAQDLKVPQQPPPQQQRPAAAAAARRRPPVTWGYLAAAFALGVVMVVIPVFAYASLAPDHSRFIGACGGLVEPNDNYKVMVPLDRNAGGVDTIEVLDPMCPQCRLFERRLESADLGDQLHRRAILFPLNSDCNWMVDSRTHPGACAISEAVLCAGDRAAEVVAWAFEEQDRIKVAAASSEEPARELARQRFPQLSRCIGSASAKSRLNKSLRWGVRNQLPLVTPQIYVQGVKLCDEDTDLGLEYALSRMVERARAGTLTQGGAR